MVDSPRAAPAHVTGHFTTPEAAKAAMVRLEGAGFDADAVDLVDAPVAAPAPEEAHHADEEALHEVTRPAATGATIGSVAGAAAGVVTGLVTGDAGTGAAVGVAAAAGGGAVGGLAGTYAGLPVNEDAWTTHELDPTDAHPLTVRVRVASMDEAETARDALRG